MQIGAFPEFYKKNVIGVLHISDLHSYTPSSFRALEKPDKLPARCEFEAAALSEECRKRHSGGDKAPPSRF
jgi:hypothetical protein